MFNMLILIISRLNYEDGHGLEEVKINDNFAKLFKALYVAKQKARESVTMRSKVQLEPVMKVKDRKES